MKRLLIVALLSLVPSAALAQIAPDAGSDVDALQAELDRDYAQALASDCQLACRALESMRRAADRLCSLDPGDRCARAKQRVEDASARVRASCPICNAELGGEKAPSVPQPSPAPPAETAVAEETVHGKGGCGGCATTGAPVDAAEPLALGALVLISVRRRRRR